MVLEESTEISEELICFLEGTELGTNGAKYTHLDVRKRIHQTDNPKSYSLKRNATIMANVTFCIRDFAYYVRYFAFHPLYQRTSGMKARNRSNSLLQQRIQHVFDTMNTEKALPFYAYIDDENSRSKEMSERFGFKPYTHIISRSYSRMYPRKVSGVSFSQDWSEISIMVSKQYANYDSYFETHIQNPPFVVLRDARGNIEAFARFTLVNWRIHRLPGFFGGALVKVLPYIPFLRRLIKPKKHFFLVPDIVQGQDSTKIEALFSGALGLYNVHSILWFVDPNDLIYKNLGKNFDWGFLDKIIGIKKVNVVSRNSKKKYSSNHPFFVSAYDLI
tara:strand:- start:11222 stop:12217 length:996 start_codon:yes stop_codon:yes gene_type:complete